MQSINGAQALLQMLAESGVRYLFGNPGTTELPLMDALVDHPEIRFILGLQEVPLMAAADGYAQASHTLGVVNVHISCGLGNAMGMLYNAQRAGSPLLVTAGQQDRRLKFHDPVLYSDMVSVARPWTKWAAEVERIEDLPAAVRRAVQVALTPPTGPVFLSIPVDIQQEPACGDLRLPPPLDARVQPPPGEIERAARILAAARNPAILVGSRVVEYDAVAPLVRLAEALGAPVISEGATAHGRLSFPSDHRLAAPGLPLWSPDIHARLEEFDVIFATGLSLFSLYIHREPEQPLPEQIRLIQLDVDPREINRSFPVEVGLLGDFQAGLDQLAERVCCCQSDDQRQAAARRADERGRAHAQLREELHAQIVAERAARPLTPATVMSSVARALPERTAVVEEAVTTTGTYLERLGAIREPDGYFAHRGWALGWGIGCALGVKLAWPDRPVLNLSGDGAAMYGIQGLWTAARYGIGCTFVICNNRHYQILKDGAQFMGLPQAVAGRFEGMDLNEPDIDFVALSRSLGVPAERISEPEAIESAIRESLASGKPRLLEVPVAPRSTT